MGRDYRVRRPRSRGQYVLGRHDSGWLQPTGPREKRMVAKIVRRYDGDIPDGCWYKKLYSVFEWS